MTGARSKRNQNAAHGDRTNLSLKTESLCLFRKQPDDRDRDPDQGQIGVAISVPLSTDLHDSQDGNEHAKIPKPSGEQERKALSKQHRDGREGHEKANAAAYD